MTRDEIFEHIRDRFLSELDSAATAFATSVMLDLDDRAITPDALKHYLDDKFPDWTL